MAEQHLHTQWSQPEEKRGLGVVSVAPGDGLAQIMLGFLEAVKTIDRDVIEIVAAHHRTLATILERRMTGSGGPYGQLLEQELKDACVRYLARRRAAGPA